MELLILGAFTAQLIVFVALGAPLWTPLAVGLALFWGYGLVRGTAPRELARMTLSGVLTARGVLESFVLIGILTAFWRADGTIAQIVVMTTPFVTPAVVPLACFLLCGLVSYLMGTSFGTAATMGTVCGMVARSMGADPVLYGGAILAGCYFGDRCSPVSSSALLVRTVTGTSMRENLKQMMRTAAVPLACSVAAYAVFGAAFAPSGTASGSDAAAILRGAFGENLWALAPAAIILVMPLLGMGMKRCMTASCVAAALVCVAFRDAGAIDLARWALLGYASPDAAVAAIMDGGGVASMVNVSVIVCLSSSYAGIFEGTGLVDGVRGSVARIGERLGPFAAVLAVGIPASMIACNQTLAIMLTQQLCSPVEPDACKLAIDLENGPVVISPLVPWSIAGTTILAFAGAPGAGQIAAIYLWLIPLWHLFCRSQKFFQKNACKPAHASV